MAADFQHKQTRSLCDGWLKNNLIKKGYQV